MQTYRVLVVDDSPIAIKTMRRLLEDEGFRVRTAATSDEALRFVREERFHVAVIDMRLEEMDEDNREGLELMGQILDIDPTTAVLIVTAYPDHRSVRRALKESIHEDSIFRLWKSPAYDFIEKDGDALKNIPYMVREAFDKVVRAKRDLLINYPEQFFPSVIDRLGFTTIAKPSAEQLREEIDELLRKMFYDWEQIEIKALPQSYTGYSKAVVFEVTPQNTIGKGETIIAKIGEYMLIEREVSRYKKFIKGMAGGNFVPTAMEPASRTRSLGGVVYTYAGLGGVIKDFADYYNTHDEMSLVIENLFQRTLNWQSQTGPTDCEPDMRRLYMPLLRLTADELREKLDGLVADGLLHRQDDKLILGGSPFGVELVNPVEYALNGILWAQCAETVIHGDLHIHNVLVDHQNNSWLIDFANTDKGPLWYDYAFFETSIRIELVDCDDPWLIYDWSKLLFKQPDLSVPPLTPALAAVPSIVRAHEVVASIRRQAFTRYADEDRRAYLFGLLFTALRLMTVRFLKADRRQHALITAALLAERLGG